MKSYLKELNVVSKPMWMIIVLWMLAYAPVKAQAIPPLERTVSITFTEEKLDKALLRLSKEARFTLSFNPAILDQQRTLSAAYTRKTVREILESIFKGTIIYKEKGNYIILTKPAAVKTSSAPAIVPITLSGYVMNAATGDKLPEVSVYDKESLTAAITNQFGFFKLTLNQPSAINKITVSKRRFMDTVLTVTPEGETFVILSLMPETPPVVSIATVAESGDNTPGQQLPKATADTVRKDTTTHAVTRSYEPQSAGRVNVTNVKDTLYRTFQASFIPFVGTNKFLSGNVINGYSFNMLGGYSMGTRYFELGGLFNINRANAGKVQIAGLFNIVGGSMEGTQIGGLFNVTGKGFHGFQLAGLVNASGGRSDGFQLAGLVNVQTNNLRGSQVAGLINIAGRKVSGTQISGLVNYGHNVMGSQIGFINVADSLRGVPIGFISYVRHGYHKLEFSVDEVFPVNMAFRTGTRQFYNILMAGLTPKSNAQKDINWYFGYGIGTAPRIFNWLNLNFDLTSSHISHGSFTDKINLLNKVYAGIELQPARKIGLAFGITLNGLLRDNTYTEYADLFDYYHPTIINTHHYKHDLDLTMWWGWKAAIRFF